MKANTFIIILLICFTLNINAQTQSSIQREPESISVNINVIKDKEPEKALPTYGIKLDRPIYEAEIEGSIYHNVIVVLEVDDWATGQSFSYYDGVKIKIKDSGENKIYEKRFNKSYLYGFSDGTLQVGKGMALCQAILFKKDDVWHLKVREMGLY